MNSAHYFFLHPFLAGNISGPAIHLSISSCACELIELPLAGPQRCSPQPRGDPNQLAKPPFMGKRRNRRRTDAELPGKRKGKGHTHKKQKLQRLVGGRMKDVECPPPVSLLLLSQSQCTEMWEFMLEVKLVSVMYDGAEKCRRPVHYLFSPFLFSLLD